MIGLGRKDSIFFLVEGGEANSFAGFKDDR